MIKVPDKFQIKFIDASRLATMARCEARFAFRCLYGYRHPEEQTIQLDYGTAMHRALPKMYSGKNHEAIETFKAVWSTFDYGDEDDKRNVGNTILRIMDFVNNHTPSNCPYEILHFEFSSPTKLISENEVPFLIDIGALYPYCGRIDAVIMVKSTGDIFAYDFKTSSELSPRYFDGFWFSPQSCGYTLALSQITGKKVNGMLYEGMRISKTNIETQLGFSYVSPHNISKFIEETKLTCARMNACNETQCWRQNHALCTTYAAFGFPCKVCEYKLLCDSPNWTDAVKYYKRVEPFNPLKEK